MRFIIFLFLLSTSSLAQQLPLETYTPANGLVDARITKLFQDSRGRIFFLTREGFSIYDGQRFTNVTSVNGIPAGMMNEIIETDSNRVMLFDFNGNIFTVQHEKITVDTSRATQLNEFNKILVLGKNDWLILTNHHLLRFVNNRFIPLKMNFNDGTEPYIDNGVIFNRFLIFYRWNVSASNQLILYNYENQQVVDLLKNFKARGLVTDHYNNIYFSEGKKWWQLNKSLLQQGKLSPEPVWFNPLLPDSFTEFNLFFDNNNNIWLLNGITGCCQIDVQTKEKKYFLSKDGLLPGMAYLYTDRENNNWFYSSANGVQKMQQSEMERIQRLADKDLDIVTGISPASEGSCLIKSQGGFFLKSKNTARWLQKKGAFFGYWQNQLWTFTDYKTLSGSHGIRIDLSKSIENYSAEDFSPSYRMTIDREGRLIMPGKCLVIVDKNYKVQVIRLPNFADNVTIDDQNNYWLFMRNGQLIKLRWVHGEIQEEFRKEISNFSPRFSIAWSADTFLVGTRNNGIKIITITKENPVITGSITTARGLSNNFIYALLKKNNHELLAGTATGLDVLHFSDQDTIIEKISARNNVFGPFGSLVMDQDSVVYAATENGQLFQYEKKPAVNSGFRPFAWFSEISVNGNAIINANAKKFSFTNNNFLFKVSAPSFLDNKNIVFVFRLDRGSRHWIQNSNKADFAINNLSPGHYTLLANIIYPAKAYPGQVITYQFTILPPFWKTWWFLTLSAGLFLVFALLIIRYYFLRKLEKQKTLYEKKQAIEKERSRIATDMHDDFGANLSRIKFLSEKLKLKKSDSLTTQTDLEKISAYSDEMAEKMGEIVWALNQKYDSPGDLITFCRAYASEFLSVNSIRLLFPETNIPEVNIPGEVRRNIFLSLKECLQNIAKHSGAHAVTIRFNYADKKLYVNVHDNGRGINFENIRPFCNGLENIRQRMKDIGGDAVIENDNGAKITLSVPMPV